MKNLLSINTLLVVVVILLSITLSVGESYATYSLVDIPKETKEVVKKDCLKLIMDDERTISLTTNDIISEEKVTQLIPYIVSVKNVCDTKESYSLNIEELKSSTIDTQYVKLKVNDNDATIMDELPLNIATVDDNAKNIYNILTDSLAPNESKTYYIRLFKDDNTSQEEIGNKTLESKFIATTLLN